MENQSFFFMSRITLGSYLKVLLGLCLLSGGLLWSAEAPPTSGTITDERELTEALSATGDITIGAGGNLTISEEGMLSMYNSQQQYQLSMDDPSARLNINKTGDQAQGLLIQNGNFSLSAGAVSIIANSTLNTSHGMHIRNTTTIMSGQSSMYLENLNAGNALYNYDKSDFLMVGNASITGTAVSGTWLRNHNANFTMDGWSEMELTVDGSGHGLMLVGALANDTGVFLMKGDSRFTANSISGSGVAVYLNSYATLSLTDRAKMIIDSLSTTSNNSLFLTSASSLFVSGNASLDISTAISNRSGIMVNNGANVVFSGNATSNITTTSSGNGIYIAAGANMLMSDDAQANVTVGGALGNGIYVLGGANFLMKDKAELIGTLTNSSGFIVRNNGSFTMEGESKINVAGTGAASNVITNNGTFIIGKDSSVRITNGGFLALANNSVTVINGQLTADNITLQGSYASRTQLAGGGTVQGSISINNTYNSISPGAWADGVSGIGTLNIIGTQSWLSGLSIDWQLGNIASQGSAGAGIGNDLVDITGALAISVAETYIVNFSTIIQSAISNPASNYQWAILRASDKITGFQQDRWKVVLDDSWSILGLNRHAFYITLGEGNTTLFLNYLEHDQDFYWNPNMSGTWDDTTRWDTPVAPYPTGGANVFFVNSQGGLATINLGNNTVAVGNITMGSDFDTVTSYLLRDGTLHMDNHGNASVIQHQSTANAGDEIRAPITAVNNLEVDIRSAPGKGLTINGSITGMPGASFTRTGTGELYLKGGLSFTNGDISFEAGNTIMSLASGIGIMAQSSPITINGTANLSIYGASSQGLSAQNNTPITLNDSAILNVVVTGGSYAVIVPRTFTLNNNARASITAWGNGIHLNSGSSKLLLNDNSALELINSGALSGSGVFMNAANGAEFTISGNARANIIMNSTVEGNGIYLSGASWVGVGDTSKLSITVNGSVGGNGVLTLGTNGISTTGGEIDILVDSPSGNGIYSNGSASKAVSTNGGTMNITLSSNVDAGDGIYNKGLISAENGTINIVQNAASGNGIYNENQINVTDGGTLKVTVGASSGSNAIYNAGNIKVANASVLNATASSSAGNSILNTGSSARINIESGAQLQHNGWLRNADGAKLVVDGTLNGGTVQLSGSSTTLAGSGTINAAIAWAGGKLSPGSMTFEGVSQIGTLTFGQAQSWTDGMFIDWQLGVGENNYDQISILGALTLLDTDAVTYTLNLNTLAGTLANQNYSWTILDATTISGFNRSRWALTGNSSFLSSMGLTGKLRLEEISNSLVLKFYAVDGNYYWGAGLGDGVWTNDDKWEGLVFPENAGDNIYLIRNQSALATVDLGGEGRLLGNLIIGSENGTTGTMYMVSNGTLRFDGNGSLSRLTHHANATGGDIIAANITMENDLVIDVQSSGSANLTINQSISNDGHVFTRTGEGNLILIMSPDYAITNNGSMIFESGNTSLNVSNTNGGVVNNGTIEISGGNFASLVTNGGKGFINSGANSSLLVSGGNFTSNVSYTQGGIRNEGNNSTLVLDGGNFTQYLYSYGDGGIQNIGIGSKVEVKSGNFVNNVTYGSGIQNSGENASLVMSGGNLTSNVTGTGSVGIRNMGDNSSISLSGGNFVQNVSAGGTGIYNIGANSSLIISGSAVLNSTVSGDSGTGINNIGENAKIIVKDNAMLYSVVDGTTGNAIVGIRNNGTLFVLTDSANLVSIRRGTDDSYGVLNAYSDNAVSTFIVNGHATMNSVNTNAAGSYNAGIYNGGIFLVTDNATLLNSATGEGRGIVNARNQGNAGIFTVNGHAHLESVYDGVRSGVVNANNGTFIVAENATFNSTNGATPSNTGNGIMSFNDATFIVTDNATLNSTNTGAGTGIYTTANSKFTVNGHATLNSNASSGTGIFNDSDASFVVSENGSLNSTVNGSATGIVNNGTLTISDNATFKQTVGDSATGILNNGTITISGANFSQTVSGAGKGIDIGSGGSLDIDGANFTNNVAGGNGIYMEANGSDPQLVVKSGSFFNNVNDGNGINTNNATFFDVTFVNNVLLGTGIFSQFSFDQGRFENNVSGGRGIYSASVASFANMTFTNNVIAGYGFLGTGSTLGISNSIFENDVSGTGTGLSITSCSTLNINQDTVFINNVTSGVGIDWSAPPSYGGFNVNNATIVNVGGGVGTSIKLDTSTTMILQDDAKILNDHLINGGGSINITGSRVLLAGSGRYEAVITGVNSTTRISPGGSYNESTRGLEGSIGTLNIKGSQSWQSGFIYDWQFGSATDTGTGANDWLNIDGSLNLSASANYLLNLGWVGNPNGDGITAGMTWTLLTASLGITNFDADTWNNNTLFQSSMEALIDQLGLTGKGKFVIQQDGSGNILQLAYQLLSMTFFWKTNTSGSWDDTNSWKDGTIPPGVGSDVYLTSNQTASTGTADLGGVTRTTGNLTLGSENASATDTHYKLINGTLTLDNNGNLSVIHHHLNAQGDEIAVTLNASNAVEIDIASKGNSSLENQSIGFTPSGETEWGRWNGKITNATLSGSGSNPILTISGDLQMNGHDLSKTGNGTLVVSGDILGAHQIVHEAGSLYLDGTVRTNSDLTVAGRAILGGSGTIVGALIFEHQAIFRQGREGAAYNDRLRVSGTAQAQGSMTFDLTAALGRAFSDNDGDSRKTATQSSGLDLTGLFSFNAASTYTVNIYNLTDFNIVDWTREKNANEGAYYQLLSWEGGEGDIDLDKWSLNFLGSVRPDDPGAWSLKLGKEGDKHILWLYYANPVRIPEPGTYAAIAGALALVLALIRRRRK